MKPIVLSLFDYSTVAVQPWADGGYECWCVDIDHEPGLGKLECNVRKIGCDVRQFEPPADRVVVFAMAFPPCDHLAVSGAAWFKGKGLRKLAESIELVACSVEQIRKLDCPYFIENPVSTLSTYWRRPDYRFDPCDYAGYLDDPTVNAYSKKTCLWTGRGFVMPSPIWHEPIYGSMLWRYPPSEDRPRLRSVTPLGFAKAVYESNSVNVPEEYRPCGESFQR